MKKAFDLNVSRAKPRLRFGAAAFSEQLDSVAPEAEALEQEPSLEDPGVDDPEALAVTPELETASVEVQAASAPSPEPRSVAPPEGRTELTAEVKVRAERSKSPRPSAAEAMQRALEDPPAPAPVASTARPTARPAPVARQEVAAPVEVLHRRPSPVPQAHAHPPAPQVEVQTPPPPREPELTPEFRRERLKERLKAVRENPRPEPLPATVAEAGTMAVERIATLQIELNQVKALNLTLTQDLEGARRQAERATEEARLRMDEARRLATEMEGRARLLADLERELSSLEGERDESLLSLQEARQGLEAAGTDQDLLKAIISERDRALAESLSEEERLASELERAHDDSASLRRTVDALKTERDTLARQVSDLTIERAELLEARKALQSVHRALSQAVSR